VKEINDHQGLTQAFTRRIETHL